MKTNVTKKYSQHYLSLPLSAAYCNRVVPLLIIWSKDF